MRSVVTRIFQGLAWLVLAGLVLEFYLAGAAVFGATTFQPHRALGVILAAAILLLLVLALVARPGRHVVGLTTLLVVLTIVQVVLPSLATRLHPSLPGVAALHVVNAAVLLAVTGAIVRAPGRKAPAGDEGKAAVGPGTPG
jgi:FtsH-binding integral membrane protein